MSNLTFDTKLKKALMKNKATIGFVDYQAQINQIKQLISETITDAEGLVESERVKPATREEKEPSCVHDFRYLEKEETKLPLRHWVKNVNKFYCTKCLEIVSK